MVIGCLAPLGSISIWRPICTISAVSFRVASEMHFEPLRKRSKMRPNEALSQAAQILVTHLRLVAGVSEEIMPVEPEEVEEEEGIPREIYETPIEQLDLSVRVFNSLKRTGITSVGEVLEMLERGEEAMLTIRNFGEKSLTELKGQLSAKGFLAEDDRDTDDVEQGDLVEVA